MKQLNRGKTVREFQLQAPNWLKFHSMCNRYLQNICSVRQWGKTNSVHRWSLTCRSLYIFDIFVLKSICSVSFGLLIQSEQCIQKPKEIISTDTFACEHNKRGHFLEFHLLLEHSMKLALSLFLRRIEFKFSTWQWYWTAVSFVDRCIHITAMPILKVSRVSTIPGEKLR